MPPPRSAAGDTRPPGLRGGERGARVVAFVGGVVVVPRDTTPRILIAPRPGPGTGRKGAWSVVQPRLCNLHWRRRRRRRRARPLIEVDGESTSFRYGVVSRRVQPRRLYILCWRELSRRRLVLPAVSPAVGHLTTPTVAGLPGLCENFRPTTSKSSPI